VAQVVAEVVTDRRLWSRYRAARNLAAASSKSQHGGPGQLAPGLPLKGEA
jgi:hypothetical protein